MSRGLLAALAAGALVSTLACRAAKDDGEKPQVTDRGAYALPVDIYFPGADDQLHPERREIQTTGDPEEQIAALVRLVLAGPESGELAAPFPEGVELSGTQLSAEGIAFVDLTSTRSGDIPAGGSTEERQRVMSLVNSVALNVSEARRVVLLWNGVQPETFGGHFDATRPFAPDLSLVARRPGEADGGR
jgi:spore germination protein GerM